MPNVRTGQKLSELNNEFHRIYGDLEVTGDILGPTIDNLTAAIQVLNYGPERMFRLAPRGIANEQVNINAAIVTLAAAGGGTIHLVQGTWNISGVINMASCSNIVLDADKESTLIVGDGSAVLVSMDGSSDCTVRNCSFKTGLVGISADNSTRATIENCKFSTYTSTAAIRCLLSTYFYIHDNIINDCLVQSGIYAGGPTGLPSYGRIINNLISNCSSSVYGIFLSDGGSTYVEGNIIYDLRKTDNAMVVGLFVGPASRVRIIDNKIEAVKNSGFPTQAYGIYMDTGIDNAVLDNQCYNNGQDTGLANTGKNFTDNAGTRTQTWGNSWQAIGGSWAFPVAPTFSTMTAGSVLFAGTGGLLSQDNANFFYDDANNRLQVLELRAATTGGLKLFELGGKGLTIANSTGAATFDVAPLVTGMTTGSIPFFGASGLLSQDNAALFWDAANKRLGVGTSAPARDFEVKGQTGNNAYLRISGAVAKQQAIELYDTATRWIIYKEASTTDLRFYDGTADRVFFQTGGNVGIGGTPSSLLHLTGATPEIKCTDTDTNKSWHFGTYGNDYVIVETGVNIQGTFKAGGGFEVLAGFGCNGKTPQAAYSLPANATDLTTAEALANALKTCLIANGIAT